MPRLTLKTERWVIPFALAQLMSQAIAGVSEKPTP
jgi:hypothetical protein